MAPKKKGDKSDAREDEDAAREALKWQALVVADWLGDGFGPLETNRALLPVCGVPLLELWLSQLLSAGCAEVFVLVGRPDHAAALRAAQERWAKSVFTKGMKVQVCELPGCASIGDALRDVNMPVLTGDFVLVQGASFVELDLAALVDQHRKRRKEDPDLVLTKVYCPADVEAVAPWERLSLIYDDATKELVTCVTAQEKLDFNKNTQNYLFKPRKNCNVVCKFDVCDSQYSICDLEVLQKIKDEHDMQDPTNDIVGVMLMAKFNDLFSSHSVQVQEHSGPVYAVHDARSLHKTNIDVLRILREAQKKKEKVRPLYGAYADDVYSRIKPNNVFTYAALPEGVEVADAILGQNVTLGEGCTVKNCIVLDGSSVGPDCEVEETLLAGTVPEGANLTQCLVHGTVVVEKSQATEAGDAEAAEASKTELYQVRVGKQGIEAASTDKTKALAFIGAETATLWEEIIEQREEAADEEQEDDGNDIHREINGILRNADERFQRSGDMDRHGVQTELRSLRMSQNMSCLDFLDALVPKLMERVLQAHEAKEKIAPVVKRWFPLVGAFRVRNSLKEGVCALEKIEAVCRDKLDPAKFAGIAKTLSDELDEIDDEEESKCEPFSKAFLEWYTSAQGKVTSLQQYVDHADVKKVKQIFEEDSESGSDSD